MQVMKVLMKARCHCLMVPIYSKFAVGILNHKIWLVFHFLSLLIKSLPYKSRFISEYTCEILSFWWGVKYTLLEIQSICFECRGHFIFRMTLHQFKFNIYFILIMYAYIFYVITLHCIHIFYIVYIHHMLWTYWDSDVSRFVKYFSWYLKEWLRG